jgi:predicted N-formylglutamate amidohydrolase
MVPSLVGGQADEGIMMSNLLQDDEPGPVTVDHEDAGSVFLIACDHAGRRLPRRLGDLGLSASDLARHIAWDIGAAGVSDLLGDMLDAVVVKQLYSRLVIDCNRAIGHATSIARRSEATDIPGNHTLSAEDAAARASEIFQPYHDRLASLLDQRQARRQPTVFVALHSFTPVFHGAERSWQAGMLYNRDPRFGRAVGELLRREGLVVGDNEPYQLSDASDYTVPVHAERRGLPYVEIEIRQDLIAEPAGQRDWAARLARILPAALPAIGMISG